MLGSLRLPSFLFVLKHSPPIAAMCFEGLPVSLQADPARSDSVRADIGWRRRVSVELGTPACRSPSQQIDQVVCNGKGKADAAHGVVHAVTEGRHSSSSHIRSKTLHCPIR